MTKDEAIRMVLRGFDEGVFVRSIDHDGDPAWAIKLFPFIQALGVLAADAPAPQEPPAIQVPEATAEVCGFADERPE